MELDWDADNLQHIARHGINPKEAEMRYVYIPPGIPHGLLAG